MVFMLAGIFNSFFIGVLLDKYQCYKKAHMFVCIGSVVTLALSSFGLPSGKTLVESAIMMLTGAAIIPNTPISFSLAAEVSHPVPESYSIGIMLCSAQLFGFILVRQPRVMFFRAWAFQQFARHCLQCTESGSG